MAKVNSELLYTLFSSLSFYRTTIWWAMLSLGLFVFLIWLLMRLRKSVSLCSLAGNDQGSSVAVDFVLTLPIFLTLLLLIVQYALMSHTALLVHYAAYSAARSARVWMWDAPDMRLWPRPIPGLRNPASRINPSPEVQIRAETAARFALIAASPADKSIQKSPIQMPVSVLNALAKTAGLDGREQVLMNKAAYAFDPANTRVEVRPAVSTENQPGIEFDLKQPADAWPVTATVSFRMALDMPIASRLLGKPRGDGSYYESSTAEVTLL